ncbi:MAG TPA: hypothetical protein VFO85_16930, partial [Vicinamibacteria bacterium]|nr:hypothetical protein [Vicinamibacteria bacterium]
LCLASPVVPALALALAALVALGRATSGEGVRWLTLAALLAGAVPFFRVFLGAHLLLGLGLAALLGGVARARPLLAAAVPCALSTAALALGRGGEPLDVALAPLDLVRVTREGLGLEPGTGLVLLLSAVAWVAASFGLRLVGIPDAWRAIRGGPAALRALGVMALAGWPIALLLRVSPPETLPGQKAFNDAYVLIEQSGPLLWIFTASALARLAGQGRRRRLVLAGAAALALPATLQFAVKKARLPYDPIPAAMVRAMDAVEAHSRPGDVVLQRPGARYPPLPVVLAGRRVVYERFTAYSTQFAPAAELARRHERIFRFFRTSDAAEAAAIARELGAVLVALYGPDRVRFDPQALLEPVHLDAQARVYRVKDASPAGPRRDAAPAPR